MPSVSIIIAVYNAEMYISSGIEGVLRQTFSDFEVIIVNDGSTDETRRICDEYARKDNRIRIFHEPHRGVAHARQIGITHARGYYTIHIDADDEIEPTMLEEMYLAVEEEQADLLICDYKEKNKDGVVYHQQLPTALNKKAIVNDLVDGILYGALWNKLIRTSCFQRHGIGFRENLSMREDMFFIFDIMPYIDRIAYLPKAFYIYDRTNNSNSLTNTYFKENRHYYDQEILWHQVALDNTFVEEYQKNRLQNALLNYAYITLSGNIYSKEEWNTIFSRFRTHFEKANSSYKKILVIMAINGSYRFSSIVRLLIAKAKGKI